MLGLIYCGYILYHDTFMSLQIIVSCFEIKANY
jgi:hypothetical protein